MPGPGHLIHLVDGSTVRVRPPPGSKNDDVCRLVAETLGMVDAGGFALYAAECPASAMATSAPERRHFPGTDIFAAPAVTRRTGDVPTGLVFRRRIDLEAFDSLPQGARSAARERRCGGADPVETHLLFIQARRDVVSGTFRVTEREAISAAALQLQAELGPEVRRIYEDPATAIEARLPELIPPQLVGTRAASDWGRAITMSHARLERVPPTRAEADYLEAVSCLPYFGAPLYDLVETDGARRRWVAAVHTSGLMLLTPGTLRVAAHYAYGTALAMAVERGFLRVAAPRADIAAPRHIPARDAPPSGAGIDRRMFEVLDGLSGPLEADIVDHAALAAAAGPTAADEAAAATLAAAARTLGLRFGYEYLDDDDIATRAGQRRVLHAEVSGRGSHGVTFAGIPADDSERADLARELDKLCSESNGTVARARTDLFRARGDLRDMAADLDAARDYLEQRLGDRLRWPRDVDPDRGADTSADGRGDDRGDAYDPRDYRHDRGFARFERDRPAARGSRGGRDGADGRGHGDHDRSREYRADYDRDHDRGYDRDYDREHHDRDRGRDYGRDSGRDYGRDSGRDYGRDRDHDRERYDRERYDRDSDRGRYDRERRDRDYRDRPFDRDTDRDFGRHDHGYARDEPWDLPRDYEPRREDPRDDRGRARGPGMRHGGDLMDRRWDLRAYYGGMRRHPGHPSPYDDPRGMALDPRRPGGGAGSGARDDADLGPRVRAAAAAAAGGLRRSSEPYGAGIAGASHGYARGPSAFPVAGSVTRVSLAGSGNNLGASNFTAAGTHWDTDDKRDGDATATATTTKRPLGLDAPENQHGRQQRPQYSQGGPVVVVSTPVPKGPPHPAPRPATVNPSRTSNLLGVSTASPGSRGLGDPGSRRASSGIPYATPARTGPGPVLGERDITWSAIKASAAGATSTPAAIGAVSPGVE